MTTMTVFGPCVNRTNVTSFVQISYRNKLNINDESKNQATVEKTVKNLSVK